MGVSCQRHAPAALYPRGKNPRYKLYTGWVGPRTGLDTEARGKIISPVPGIEPRSPGRPVRSQTLNWLSYPGSQINTKAIQKSKAAKNTFEKYAFFPQNY
jgi:hypothetical protein